jgi:hypothetical protein
MRGGRWSVCVVIAAIMSIVASVRARAATVSWLNAASGNWSDTANWDTGTVPTAADDVVIAVDGTYTVTVDVDTTVASLSLGGATGVQTLLLASHTVELSGVSAVGAAGAIAMTSGVLTADAPLTVSGTLAWSGGTLQGAIVIGVAGTFTVSGSAPKLLQAGVPATSVTNAGATTWTGTGALTLTSATFTNQASGTFTIQTDAALSGTGTFANAGTFVKNGAVSLTMVQLSSFANTGTVSAQTGILRFPGAVTSSGAGNAFDAATGTEVSFQSDAACSNTQFTGAGVHRFQGTGTFTLAGNIATSNLEFAGDAAQGGLLASPSATIVGTLAWTSGIVRGTLTVPGASTLAISGVATKTIDGSGPATVVHNAGTTTWAGNGALVVTNGATFDNQTTGLFAVQTDAALQGGAAFTNAGTFAKTGGAGPTSVQLAFTNTGAVQVQTSILRFPNPLGSSGPGNGFDAANGAEVDFLTDATFSGTTFSGVGVHRIQGTGAITMSGTIASTNLEFAGDATTGGLVANPPATIAGTLSWTSGTVEGMLTIPAGNTLAISGSGTKTLEGAGPATAIHNAGTVTFGGTGALRLLDGAAFDNQAGGLFNVLTDATITGDGTFTNAGTFLKSGAGGPTALQLGGFVNTGAVQVTSGVIQFPNPVTSSGGGNTFDAATTTQILFLSDATLTDTTLSGVGVHRIQGTGTISLGGTITSSNLEFAGDAVNGGIIANPAVTIAGTLNWTSGVIQGAVTIPSSSTLALGGVGTKTLKGGTFATSITTAGTTTWTGTGALNVVSGATFTNQAGGTFALQSDGTLGGNATFANAGTFTKSVATGTTQVQLASFTNTGTLTMQTGVLAFSSGYVQTAGSTVLAGGNLAGPGLIDIQGGTLTGAGFVTGSLRNAAQFLPGGAGTGLLNVMGAYTQAAGGTLNIGIGGTTPGTGFDQIPSSGAASLAGTLNVALVNGFTPSAGMTFQILTYGSRTGDFTTTNGLIIGGGLGFKRVVGTTDMKLTVVQELCCNGIDDDNDGKTDSADPKCAGFVCPTTTTTTSSSSTTTTPGATTTTTTTIPQCANGRDDDGDGLVDCADPNCAGDPLCAQPGHEVCGNCIDDDGNGLTDYEDAVCCTGAPATSLALKQGRFKPGSTTSLVTLRAVLGGTGFPSVNPLLQDVYVQVRPDGAADVLCAQLPASEFGRKGRRFVFADPKHKVASAHGINRLTITIRPDGTFLVRLTGKQMALGVPDAGTLWLTLGFHDPVETEQPSRCETTSQPFTKNARGVLHYP